ncbi:hypothetical protein [Oceanobacillus profundus]|uniref:Uncharacterized protein n=1 Tax=Oceanobacillus profundus TaxID=372463 RepID=A0A417YGP0_9BACI|nr:hypothetical protein [Oceanobacillus profundus]RHW31955.1 hypothetical protein D1B32_12000 [Oceanobacillus profundus]
MNKDELFNALVNGFVGSWASGINAVVCERKPISYGVQCILEGFDTIDTVQVNVYNSKKGVRIVIQGKDSELLELAKKAIPSGEITEELLRDRKYIYV